MNTSELTQQAQELVTIRIRNKQPVQRDWAVHELLLRQGDIAGPGVEFYQLCAIEHCRTVIKRVIDKYDRPESRDEEKQILLEGFEHLQEAYSVARDGEIQIVPIELMTSDERLWRADQYDSQAKGLRAHAKELRDYDSSHRAKVA